MIASEVIADFAGAQHIRAASCRSDCVSASPYGNGRRSYGRSDLTDESFAYAGAAVRTPTSAIVESVLHDLMASSFRRAAIVARRLPLQSKNILRWEQLQSRCQLTDARTGERFLMYPRVSVGKIQSAASGHSIT